MAGNNVSRDEWGNIPKEQKTHIDTGFRIMGHKVLISKDNPKHIKNVLTSNSPNTVYAIAVLDDDGHIFVRSINYFVGYHLHCEVNIEFDSNNNVIPYNFTEKGSHCHFWKRNESGTLERKKHDKKNYFDILPEHLKMVKEIEKFNKMKNLYKK